MDCEFHLANLLFGVDWNFAGLFISWMTSSLDLILKLLWHNFNGLSL